MIRLTDNLKPDGYGGGDINESTNTRKHRTERPSARGRGRGGLTPRFSPVAPEDIILMMFSGGKDAIATAHLLRSHLPNHQIIWVYFYLVEGLSFVERTLQHYEKRWCVRIHRRPCHETLSLRAAREGARKKKYSYSDTERLARDEFGASWTCDGMKKADSLARVGMLKKLPHGVDEKSKRLHPVFDWSHKKITAYCTLHKLPLPRTYSQGVGRSVWIPDAELLIWLRSHYRQDYEKIIAAFPEMGDAVFKRLRTT